MVIYPKMKKKCSDCGSTYNGDGVCPNCGLVDDEYKQLADEALYPYDEDKITHYGDPKTVGVSDISLMTKINARETFNNELKRAIGWDGRYGWNVAKTEIVNAQIKSVCSELGLKKDFRDTCILFFRVYTENFSFAGKKLENIAAAIIYLLIRYYNLPYTLYDFTNLDFNASTVYRYYGEIVRKLDLFNFIKPQDQRIFIIKFINELIPDDYKTFHEKYEFIQFVTRAFVAFVEVGNLEDLFMSVGLGMIGACVYIASKKSNIFHFTQKGIAEICGVSEVTLREYIKKIKKSLI